MEGKKAKIFFCLVALALVVTWTACAGAAELRAHKQGGILPGPNYDWWYGCSATSAGMMMGYYDRNGYGGLSYINLVPGGQAELNNFGLSIAQRWASLANNAIASNGHVTDFYRFPGGGPDYSGGGSAYGLSNDDQIATHSFNCLADFMGTNQDLVGNSNASTTFWNYTNGARLYADQIYALGPSYYNSDGMYGMAEYLYYAGYGVDPSTNHNFFSQYIDPFVSGGFSLADYQAEIDDGRVVMIHVEGHSMFGYGYDGNTIYVHDTWSTGDHTMTWGGSYAGMTQYGVTCFTPTGGTVVTPLPPSVFLMGSGLLGLVIWRRRKS